jgi:hypothetical protein
MNPNKKKLEDKKAELVAKGVMKETEDLQIGKELPNKLGVVQRMEMVKQKGKEMKKPKDEPKGKPEGKPKILPTESMGKAVLTTPRISVQRPRTILPFRKTQTKKTITTPYGKINLK